MKEIEEWFIPVLQLTTIRNEMKELSVTYLLHR